MKTIKVSGCGGCRFFSASHRDGPACCGISEGMEPVCMNCKAWKSDGVRCAREDSYGLCRLYAPRPVAGKNWPLTHALAWCLEFEPRPKTLTKEG